MFNEYDDVRLKKGAPTPESYLTGARPVTHEDRGVVVYDYHAYPPAYIVEFFDSQGRTVDVVDVKGEDLVLETK
jgi:hypothetical protein